MNIVANIIGSFSTAAIIIVVTIFFRLARKEAQKEAFRADRMHFIVRTPKLYKVVGIVDAALFGTALVFSSFTAGDDPAYPFFTSVFACLFLLGIFIIFYSIRCRIIVEGSTITVTPLFKKETTFSVKKITHIKADVNLGVRVYSGKEKLFTMDSFSIGSGMFVEYLIENGVSVPDRINMPRY